MPQAAPTGTPSIFQGTTRHGTPLSARGLPITPWTNGPRPVVSAANDHSHSHHDLEPRSKVQAHDDAYHHDLIDDSCDDPDDFYRGPPHHPSDSHRTHHIGLPHRTTMVSSRRPTIAW